MSPSPGVHAAGWGGEAGYEALAFLEKRNGEKGPCSWQWAVRAALPSVTVTGSPEAMLQVGHSA